MFGSVGRCMRLPRRRTYNVSYVRVKVLQVPTTKLFLEGVHGQHAADITRVIPEENSALIQHSMLGSRHSHESITLRRQRRRKAYSHAG
jgi:hypothetical protein